MNGDCGDFDGVEALSQIQQQLRVEAGADLAGEDEVAAFVVADEQRAEPDARALRIGEPADDELLRRLAFHLQPVFRAAMLVGRAAALGDDAFPSFAARALPRVRRRRAARRGAAAVRTAVPGAARVDPRVAARSPMRPSSQRMSNT